MALMNLEDIAKNEGEIVRDFCDKQNKKKMGGQNIAFKQVSNEKSFNEKNYDETHNHKF